LKRILVISWFYPPINSSEGLVTYKLLKASEYEYTVFTQNSSDLWSYGKEDFLPTSENVSVHFSKADNLEDWEKESVEYYKANIDKFDIVMTRSMPPESHKVGLKIKKINPNIKWIASFGDPIADNPYTKIATYFPSPYSYKNCRNILGYISPKRIIKSFLFNCREWKRRRSVLKSENEFQSSIFKYSDYIIMNSSYQRDYMLEGCSDEIKNKAVVLNHSFDESLYPAKTAKATDKIKMTYVGHLDDIRTPKLLFSAIKELYDEHQNLSDKIEFSFYGNLSDADKLFIINNQLTDLIKVKKAVSYTESLEIMSNSDWLLQIDANIYSAYDKNIFFAAKLADYIGSGSKIFGITMMNGISADIMRNLNTVVMSHSKEEIKNYLWLIIFNGLNAEINQEFRNEFNSKSVAKKFDEIIYSIRSK